MLYPPIATLILLGSSALSAAQAPDVGQEVVQYEKTQDSAEASKLLNELRSIAYDLRRDAATLESYKLTKLSWQTHADQLSLAKEHINAIGARLETLQTIRATAEPWQQQAIDAIVPVAARLAARTEDAINHLNENRRYLFAPVYTNHLSEIASTADQMKQSVDLHLELASTQDKLETLRERVTVVGS